MTTTALPTIDFSTPSRKMSRDYAAVLQSRVIDEKHNKTLQRVEFGAEDVDALALNEALMAAMRSGATRFGQSMARREFTSKVAHLGYIVQAVLGNHANQLPPYEGGPRSPRIAALEASLEESKVVERDLLRAAEDAREGLRFAEKLWEQERSNLTQAAFDERRRLVAERDTLLRDVESLNQEIAENQQQAADERRRLVAQIDSLRAQRDELTAVPNRATDVSTERDTLLAETVQERDTLGAVLAYVLEGEDEEYRQRIFGYWDAILDATGQDRD